MGNKIVFLIITLLFFSTFLFSYNLKIVTEDFPPFNYLEDGELTGACTEIIKEMLNRAEINYTIEVYPWERAYELSKKEADTMVYSIARSPYREDIFIWGRELISFDIALYKLKDRPDIIIEKLSDAGHYKIGTVEKDYRAEYLKEKGFGSNLNLFANDMIVMRKLRDKNVDLIPISKLNAIYTSKKIGLDYQELERKVEVTTGNLYFAFNKKTPFEVVEKCQSAFDQMKQDGTYQKIIKKYKEAD